MSLTLKETVRGPGPGMKVQVPAETEAIFGMGRKYSSGSSAKPSRGSGSPPEAEAIFKMQFSPVINSIQFQSVVTDSLLIVLIFAVLLGLHLENLPGYTLSLRA